MENYLLVNNYGKSNTPDRIYYIMTRSDLPNLIKEESVVFGDKAYILEEGTMMFMGNDGIWYDTEGEVPVVTTKELNVTENGTYTDPDPYVAYRPVNVQVTDYNVEELNVTENGTYSESGKAYSPVIVNVPLPENAYLKKDLPTGAIATVTDAEAEIMPSLKVAITPVQEGSGDPSPDNIRPISGWTGAEVQRTGINLFNKNAYTVGNVTFKDARNDSATRSGIKIKLPNGTYTFKCFNETVYGYIYVYKNNGGNYIADYKLSILPPSGWKTYAITVNAGDELFLVAAVGGSTLKLDMNLEIVAGNEEPTTYEPYTDTTYPIPFPSEAGTVYGGTLDVTNGTLTVTHGYISDLGTRSWTNTSTASVFVTINDIPGIVGGESGPISPQVDIMCSKYQPTSKIVLASGLPDKKCTINLGGKKLVIADSSYLSVSDFTQSLSDAQFVYELETPITYQLTPTEVQMLLGTNNLWADTGDILEGKYWSKNPVTVTQTMLSTLRSAGEITEITPEEPEELEALEENDER